MPIKELHQILNHPKNQKQEPTQFQHAFLKIKFLHQAMFTAVENNSKIHSPFDSP